MPLTAAQLANYLAGCNPDSPVVVDTSIQGSLFVRMSELSVTTDQGPSDGIDEVVLTWEGEAQAGR